MAYPQVWTQALPCNKQPLNTRTPLQSTSGSFIAKHWLPEHKYEDLQHPFCYKKPLKWFCENAILWTFHVKETHQPLKGLHLNIDSDQAIVALRCSQAPTLFAWPIRKSLTVEAKRMWHFLSSPQKHGSDWLGSWDNSWQLSTQPATVDQQGLPMHNHRPQPGHGDKTIHWSTLRAPYPSQLKVASRGNPCHGVPQNSGVPLIPTDLVGSFGSTMSWWQISSST